MAMACSFLDKLAPELREKIYEYVLAFDDVPLRHATQLQPFVKKLTVSCPLHTNFQQSVTRSWHGLHATSCSATIQRSTPPFS
jgi:hypothetical protein